ncbi:aspartate 4-decarboxylase [Alicyclobacillus sacchari]|uniref:Aminotransferase n=1 Tax=Alicyclobacillus sacchari TaxID=392010 RepID=A0A4R8LSH3_9BACL|nr:aspartate 4-decarboxylase [Alicyclobacillus sacchari]
MQDMDVKSMSTASQRNGDVESRRKMERSFEAISPFEFRHELIKLARGHQRKSAKAMLDAGRGNPNWVAAAPREAFFALGQFAMQECRRVWDDGDLAGMPRRPGIGERFQAFVAANPELPGIDVLAELVKEGERKYGFVRDEWLHELVDGIVGDNYPTPDRMLTRTERVVANFLAQKICGGGVHPDDLRLFAVEGATAAMCYIFDSLLANGLLERGAKVAIMVPIFPPYVEIPELDRYAFDVIEIRATGRDAQGRHTWQYPHEEIAKLGDPSVQALFLVNPSNPPSVAIDRDTVAQLVRTVREQNPNLMIISDDVYGTFVDGYRSLMAELPYNTMLVYSLSKFFGVTGWRLGAIALHRDNVFDARLGRLPKSEQEKLRKRYGTVSRNPEALSFIDRMVADSRQVALNHTAGLSTPQQVQMALMCAFAMTGRGERYKQLTKEICHRRMCLLYDGLELPLPQLPHDADYYTEIDIEHWSANTFGETFTQYMMERYEPIDILFRLAEQSGIVLMNGGGFHGPKWSIRISLANLDDEAYAEIGHHLRAALQEYVDAWRKGTQDTPSKHEGQ